KKSIIYPFIALLLFLGCSEDAENPSPSSANVDKSANLLITGASANDILSNNTFDKLLIEIAYVSGYQPTTEAIASFEEFLRVRTFKEDIEFKYTSLSSPDEDTLTLKEIMQLETDNRTVYNDGSTLAIYIYFADAPSDSDDEDENTAT